ncbi:hypothetical protein M3Y99_01717500 [Aphelenchoides fujianensis]|nr:hypothetical protein M3Y99_01717500 [Aphelenchoides fujianensis]
MTTANLLSMNKCADRPKLAQLFEQYNQGAAASTVRYDQLREQNRARQFGAPSPLSSDVSQSMGRQETFDLTPPATSTARSRRRPPGPAMISGTPTRRDPSAFYSNESRAQRPEGSNQYGDRDFS